MWEKVWKLGIVAMVVGFSLAVYMSMLLDNIEENKRLKKLFKSINIGKYLDDDGKVQKVTLYDTSEVVPNLFLGIFFLGIIITGLGWVFK